MRTLKGLGFALKHLVLSIVLTAVVGLDASIALAQAETPEQWSPQRATLSDLVSAVREKILDTSVDSSQKSMAIDQLFVAVDAACQANCKVPLQILEEMNALVRAPEVASFVSSYMPEQETRVLTLQNDWEKWRSRLQDVLHAKDPEVLRARIHASLELTRYVIRLKEEEAFLLAQKGMASPEAQEIIEQNRKFLVKQGYALFQLGNLFHKKSQDASDLTVAEAKVLAGAINDLGVFYAKFIQSISNNSLLFEERVRAQFKHFQDGLEAIPGHEVRRIVERELGGKLEAFFVDFDVDRPFKSATIAQTYKARIKTLTGHKEVIVKVQRPGLEESLDSNRALNEVFIKAAKVAYPQEGMSPVLDIVASQVTGFTEAVRGELDFRSEAANLLKARDFFRLFRGVEIPKPVLRLTTSKVLVMELLDMQNIDSLVEADRVLEDESKKMNSRMKERMFGNLLESFFYQMLILGEVHADLHPGNILAEKSGQIGLIDWSQLTPTRGLVTDPGFLILAIMRGDSKTAARRLLRIGEAGSQDLPVLESLIQRILQESKLESRSYKQLVLGDGQSFEVVMKALVEILREAQMKHGFKVSSKYIQFVRSVLPISSTLTVLAKDIPKKRLIQITAWRFGLIATRGSASAIVGSTLQAGRWGARWIQHPFVQVSAPRCHLIFAH